MLICTVSGPISRANGSKKLGSLPTRRSSVGYPFLAEYLAQDAIPLAWRFLLLPLAEREAAERRASPSQSVRVSSRSVRTFTISLSVINSLSLDPVFPSARRIIYHTVPTIYQVRASASVATVCRSKTNKETRFPDVPDDPFTL
ncbi:hypothetical protein J6590_044793 [Homalodisca vitripennis]|nr:hypothetical protein J6590_044793 [Homalodisca vitripennis]